MTNESDRRLLLQLARDAVAAHVSTSAVPSPPRDGVFARAGGAFVTLHIDGDLRGCIGRVEATDPLGHVVVRCAVAACSADPRFPPVTAAELSRLDIELSLLGPLEPVAVIDEIEIGRHGLVVEMHWRRGLLLPQVATEWRWDRETFVVQTCVKAGLPRDAWKTGATLKKFEAEVFGDR
ncbi:MAG: AmmeMemoRadiSam system protein A [Acidobacteria bacterium]|nr:AmmeMemoRadiSam system protein A [Acidobacteriota bacterium]